MNILIVGNILKDVYLNLDTKKDHLETDRNGTKWLNVSFNASEHHFFNRHSSFGGATVSLEVFEKLGLNASISDASLKMEDNEMTLNSPAETYRYILIADEKISYFAPSEFTTTRFTPPAEAVDYLYLDRSAEIDSMAAKKIHAYLDIAPRTKLVLYLRTTDNPHLNSLLSRAELVIYENNRDVSAKSYAPELGDLPPEKIIHLSDHGFSYLNVTENLNVKRIDMLTHLSLYSIISATILSGFIHGYTVEKSFKLARLNAENSRLNATLSLNELENLAENASAENELELVAASLVLHPKGILAADESGGSIKKKFAQLDIPDTYDNRRDYRNIFLSTPDLEKYVNGVILFDETSTQLADNGQDFVNYLISRRIIPGIKVDQGLETFPDSEETYTKGLDGLDQRLKTYRERGLRFAKWRAAFEIQLSDTGEILTPTARAISENCRILAEYAKKCQAADIVPIVEPEVVYDGYYPIEISANILGQILDTLFNELAKAKVNLKACILKTSMVLAGKKYETGSTPEEVGKFTAEVLKNHVPESLAGVVFLSGGQTVEQATDNLAAVTKNGPFPWPVTFSFARALQDPALFAWAGDNNNATAAKKAFLERLIANTEALRKKE